MDFDISYDIILQIKNKGVKGLKRGIRGHDVERQGLLNICQRMREMDCEYIQLVLERSLDGFETGKFSEEYAKTIKDQLGDIKIAVFGSYINPADRNPESLAASLARFKEKIHYASVLKPIVVGTETGVYFDDKGNNANNTEEAYQYVLKSFKELVAEAEKYNVNIGIEGVHLFVINTPERMNRIVNDLNSDNVRVIFDPVNYININNYMNQDTIINTAFNLFGDKIAAIHAKDFDVVDGNIQKRIPGEGILNYDLIFEQMYKHNLDIPIISEEICDTDGEKGLNNLERKYKKRKR